MAGLSVTRLLIAAAVYKGWIVHQADIQTAYLNGDVHEEIFMTQPTGFVTSGSEDKVCRLKRSLYGLKQSGRCWNEKMNKKFLEAGLLRSKVDPCVYYRQLDEEKGIVSVFVDDDTLIAETEEGMVELKQLIGSKFKYHDLGPLHHLLGVRITHEEDGSLFLDQETYVHKVLEKFGMTSCYTVGMPLEPGLKLSKDQCPTSDEERARAAKLPFRELVGSLMYLAHSTRPDICYSVAKLGQFANDPGWTHWSAAKRVLRYLKGTSSYKLHVRGEDIPLTAFVDSDWAGDADDRKSHLGYVLLLGGSPVVWKSAKQTCVATSTMEAEYVALASCVKEVLWVRQLFAELRLEELLGGPTIVHCDNQAAIVCAQDPVPRAKSRHIDVRYHMIRNAVEEGHIRLEYVQTKLNLADILTKALPKPRHIELTTALRLQSYQC